MHITPEYIIHENAHAYEMALHYGFILTELCENGRLALPEFLDRETLEFNVTGHYFQNALTFGRGLNGKWCFGISASTGNAGESYGLSVFSPPYETKTACLKAALETIIAHHEKAAITFVKDTCGNFNSKFSKAVLALVRDKLNTLTGKKTVQLSLFG